MATIQIRDVPEAAYKVLRARAAAENQSIQQYMLGLINRHSATPTMDEALARARANAQGTFSSDDVLDLQRALRESDHGQDHER